MKEFTEITAENLRYIRGSKGMRQEEVAELLGVPRNAISKIEGGSRTLTDAEKRLLDWYFFGKLPPRLVSTLNLHGALEFSPGEWNLVEQMARRAGQSPAKWIRSKIVDYLTWSPETRRNQVRLRVADDEKDYQVNVIDPAEEAEKESNGNGGDLNTGRQ